MNLVVFDLDFTLWDCGGTYCDCTNPPFIKKNNTVYDNQHRKISLYPDALPILMSLRQKGILMAIASRTYQPAWAKELINMLNIGDFFEVLEIFPADKTNHFKNIQNKTNIPYQQMLFFDDEHRNIQDVQRLGVHSVLVEEGINVELLRQYITL